jgi:hypothetical protein
MKKSLSDKARNIFATVLGLLTSACTALAVIDFETFDIHSFKDQFRVFVILMPAIGGYISKLKEPVKK